jgi:DNA-binding beta-propeller fold protein YncE
MDDKPLHDLLDGALAGEPPIGPVEHNSLTAGIRLRRRRRLRAAAATTAAVAVIAVVIPAGLGAFGHLLRPQGPHRPPILYVYSYTGSHGATVTPISTATNTPGTPIHVGGGQLGWSAVGQIVITPDGKTAYVTGPGTVTPISTATNIPGTPIHIPGGAIRAIATTPDGKTAYVTTESGTVTPINTATNTPGAPIHLGGGHPRSGIGQIAITPDGKTAYVATPSGVTPINTATNTPGKPIYLGQVINFGAGGFTENIAITPDGKTAYVINQGGSVRPISTATNAPGKPISGGSFNLVAGTIAITPDGRTAYAATTTFCHTATCPVTVIPINTATNTPGTPITFKVTAKHGSMGQITITPDGKTAYVTTGSTVTPINTATNTPGKPIHIGAGQIVITPDGKTAYVTTGSTVTPINTATNTPGKPIHVSGAVYQAVIAITPPTTPSADVEPRAAAQTTPGQDDRPADACWHQSPASPRIVFAQFADGGGTLIGISGVVLAA